MRNYLTISLLFVIVSLSGQPDSPREFDPEIFEKYAAQRDFEYMKYTAKPPSVWDRISWWFQSIISRFFMNPNTPWLTQIAYYLLLLLVLGLAIFYIIRLRYGGGLATDYQRHHIAINDLQNSKIEDFDQLIDTAIKKEDFRLAIRYVYLNTLYILSSKGLIKLKDYKSPYDYEGELRSELVESYRQIARLFEYVWYGDFEVGEEEYKQGVVLFNRLERTA